MKNKLNLKFVFFNLRVLTAAVFCLAAISAMLLAMATVDPAHGNWATGVDKSDVVGRGGGATPTPTPVSCGWSAGPNMPSADVRSVGVYFPANFQRSRTPPPLGLTLPHGKFYAMGGSSSDTAGSDFMHPFEYDPAANSWTVKPTTYPDNQVSNMACAVLNVTGGDYIYCVGGSAAGATTATDRVFRYNPVTGSIITITAPWPGAMGTILPGGFSVFNNKLYILGGFNINVGMVDTIWEFTPDPAGWVQKGAHLPTALGYIPAATIGSHIYTAGGSTWDGTTLHDSNFSFAYDPVADVIANIATIPRSTSETRGLNFCDTMYVMGGGRDAPNPSNEVNVYDPGTNSWSTDAPFMTGRRDFPTDTDGTQRIVLSGGYAPTDPTDSMESFDCPVSPCVGSITPSPTVMPSATVTPSATPTATVRPSATPRTTPTPRPTPTPP
jgi:Kelch motif